MVSNEERRSLDHLVERLTAKYSSIGRDQIAVLVSQAHDGFANAKVRDFVPLFVERRVEVLLHEHNWQDAAATG